MMMGEPRPGPALSLEPLACRWRLECTLLCKWMGKVPKLCQNLAYTCRRTSHCGALRDPPPSLSKKLLYALHTLFSILRLRTWRAAPSVSIRVSTSGHNTTQLSSFELAWHFFYSPPRVCP